jgi:hypothetical protein
MPGARVPLRQICRVHHGIPDDAHGDVFEPNRRARPLNTRGEAATRPKGDRRLSCGHVRGLRAVPDAEGPEGEKLMEGFFEREPNEATTPDQLQVAHCDAGGYMVVEPVGDDSDPDWEPNYEDVAGPFKKMSKAERWIDRARDRMLAEGRYTGRAWWRGERVGDETMKGKRVRLIASINPAYDGAEGEVEWVDEFGDVSVRWDDGSSFAVMPGRDRWEIIEEDE